MILLKDIQVLILGICVTFNGKKGLCKYSYGKVVQDTWVGQNVITGVFYEREAKGDLTPEAEGNVVTEARCYVVGFEGGGRGYKPRNTRSAALRVGKDKKTNSSVDPLKECGFDFNPVRRWTFWPPDLSKYKLVLL